MGSYLSLTWKAGCVTYVLVFEEIKPEPLDEDLYEEEESPPMLERFFQNQRLENLYTLKCYFAVLLLLYLWPGLLIAPLNTWSALVLAAVFILFYGYEIYVMRQKDDAIMNQEALLVLVTLFLIPALMYSGLLLTSDGELNEERYLELSQVKLADYIKWIVIVTVSVYVSRKRALRRWEKALTGAKQLNPAAASTGG